MCVTRMLSAGASFAVGEFPSLKGAQIFVQMEINVVFPIPKASPSQVQFTKQGGILAKWVKQGGCNP